MGIKNGLMNKFVMERNVIDRYRFSFHNEMGQKLLHGHSFHNKANCLQAISQARASAANPDCYLRRGTEQKHYSFILLSEKGISVGVSNLYKGASEMERAIAEVMQTAEAAQTISPR
jgi:uncharacterized protein YegP (UPF0339 family)